MTNKEMEAKVDKIGEDVAYIKGKLDQQRDSNKDWLSRIGLSFLVLWTLFKDKVGG